MDTVVRSPNGQQVPPKNQRNLFASTLFSSNPKQGGGWILNSFSAVFLPGFANSRGAPSTKLRVLPKLGVHICLNAAMNVRRGLQLMRPAVSLTQLCEQRPAEAL